MRFLTIILFSFSLNASMLFDKSYPICIEDYYINNGSLFFQRSSNLTWGSTTANNNVQYIYYGYDYNITNGNCSPKPYIKDLGLSYFNFHFLMALSGLLFGVIIFWLLSSFLIGL